MTVNPKTKVARRLRRDQTDAEAKLWSKIRDRRLAGLKFRRQIVRGPYIVDFICDEAMLVVELDGAIHSDGEIIHRDEQRTAYLEALGYQVLRIWNVDLDRSIVDALDTIYLAASTRIKPPSSGLRPPSPQGEKEKGNHS